MLPPGRTGNISFQTVQSGGSRTVHLITARITSSGVLMFCMIKTQANGWSNEGESCVHIKTSFCLNFIIYFAGFGDDVSYVYSPSGLYPGKLTYL